MKCVKVRFTQVRVREEIVVVLENASDADAVLAAKRAMQEKYDNPFHPNGCVSVVTDEGQVVP